MKKAFIFPGQGSQYVGMGEGLSKSFLQAKEVFQEVDEALSENLSNLIFRGDQSELTLTENAQPAIMATSIAVLRVIEHESGKKINQLCDYVAGHSLGEYSALIASGAIPLSDGAKLLKLRGKSMQKAVPAGEGGMAALLGLEFSEAEEIARNAAKEVGGLCQIANDNSVGQIVISGHMQAVEKAIEITKYKGKKAVLLPVSAPFHSELMSPAAKIMEMAFNDVNFSEPLVDLVANVTADITRDPNEIKELLTQQVTKMVRWRESIIRMQELGVGKFAELGPGKVLAGLNKRIDRYIETINIAEPTDLDVFMEALMAG